MLLHVLLHFGNTNNILTTSKEFCKLFTKSKILYFVFNSKNCLGLWFFFCMGILSKKERNMFSHNDSVKKYICSAKFRHQTTDEI